MDATLAIFATSLLVRHSERVGWSPGAFYETPARELPALAFEQAQRIAALQSRYQVQLERRMTLASSTNDYEYLHILDRAGAAF
jgi:hypothetical protein